MSIEDIIKRGFKDEAGYAKAPDNASRIGTWVGYSYKYSFRLKDKATHVDLEEKITYVDKYSDGSINYSEVKEPFHVVKSWNKNGIYPLGINNIPNEGLMSIKFSDGSISTFNHDIKFTEIYHGSDSAQAHSEPKVVKPEVKVKQTSEADIKALDRLIDAALEDFVVTDEERATLLKKADSIGLSRDEFKMLLDSRIQRRMKEKPDEKTEEKKKGFFARLFGK